MCVCQQASQASSAVKNPLANAEFTGHACSIPGSGRSPGGGHGNPVQYFCLEILWTEEPGGMQSMGSRFRHDRATEHACVYVHI